MIEDVIYKYIIVPGLISSFTCYFTGVVANFSTGQKHKCSSIFEVYVKLIHTHKKHLLRCSGNVTVTGNNHGEVMDPCKQFISSFTSTRLPTYVYTRLTRKLFFDLVCKSFAMLGTTTSRLLGLREMNVTFIFLRQYDELLDLRIKPATAGLPAGASAYFLTSKDISPRNLNHKNNYTEQTKRFYESET